jgi:hypothetical protein
VLNLISSTHARPTTGVVLDQGTPQNNALVLVPADFVAAGDNIIVLDGGNDISTNGRSTRTVARSAEAGVALLEVEGLQRPGVSVSADVWRGDGTVAYEFMAWPAAEALVEGAALIRLAMDPEIPMPEVPGPVFDHCGYLAALHLAADDGRQAASESLAEFLRAWDISFSQASCISRPGEVAAQDEEEAEADLPSSDISETASIDGNPGKLPEEELSSLSLDRTQMLVLVLAWALLGLLAMVLYVRRQKRKEGVHIVLERQDNSGQRFQHKLRLRREDNKAKFERGGQSVNFRIVEQGILVSKTEDESSDRIELLLEGTPCLAGESYLVSEGQQIQLGSETFTVHPDSESPDMKQVNS